MTDSDWLDDGIDELEAHEFPDEDEGYDELDAATLPCPSCGTEIDEEAVRCPHCGSYVTHTASIWSGRSAWWIVLGILGILAVILSLCIGF